MTTIRTSIVALLALCSVSPLLAGPDAVIEVSTGKDSQPSWKDKTISPVANPLYFEDPVIRNEFRPIFMYHNIDDGFITNGGDIQLAGAQLRLALTDRLQLIANKGGYMWINPGAGQSVSGWANLVAGLKYSLIDCEVDQFILTPGLTYEIPLGERDIFHGTGDGVINLFASAAKGYGDFHLTGYGGYQHALEGEANSSMVQFNVQADYFVNCHFIPFVTMSTWTVTNAGSANPVPGEGYDAINFGSSLADGVTQAVLGVGFRSRLNECTDFGFAYQKALASPEGAFDNRLTFDISYRWK